MSADVWLNGDSVVQLYRAPGKVIRWRGKNPVAGLEQRDFPDLRAAREYLRQHGYAREGARAAPQVRQEQVVLATIESLRLVELAKQCRAVAAQLPRGADLLAALQQQFPQHERWELLAAVSVAQLTKGEWK